MREEYVKIGDVAKEFSVSVSTIRKWLREDKIPRNTYIKAGRTYRFNLGAVTEALRGGPPLMVDLTSSQTALVERLDVPISTSVPTGIAALDEDF
jgi:excisionase family DNA binding protein|tara:strand:+ start:256 stop:540 length:285 start_codon:yes stop_codon:yes gene_type:complete